MHIQFRQLEIIRAIAEQGSLTAAADKLGVTQPAISIQLRKLETQLGLALAERSGRHVTLTEAGVELLRHARRLAQGIDDMQDSLEQFRTLDRGHLRLAVVSTANYFIPDQIARFRQDHPGIEINLHVANRNSVFGELEANEADLAITGQPWDDADLVARPFKENPLVVIAPAGHPLANQTNIPVSELSQFPHVVRESGSGTRAAMERAFQSQDIDFSISCVLSSNEAVKQAVQANLGIAVISQQTTEIEQETGRLTILDVQGFPIMRQWYLVYRNFKRLPPAALAFRNQLLT